MSKKEVKNYTRISNRYISIFCGVMSLLSALLYAASLGADWTVTSVISLVSTIVFGLLVYIFRKDEC